MCCVRGVCVLCAWRVCVLFAWCVCCVRGVCVLCVHVYAFTTYSLYMVVPQDLHNLAGVT